MQRRLVILMEAEKIGRFDPKASGRYFKRDAEWRAARFGV